jgi:DNA-binding NarL/FixJ family response regulator
MGNYYQAVAHLEESLVLMRETGDRRGIASVLDGFAKLAAELRQSKPAERLFEVAARLREASDMSIADGKLTNYEYLVAAIRTQLKEQAFGSFGTEGQVMETEQVTTTVEVAKGAKYDTTMPPPATLKVRPSTYPAGLTAREVEVLRLVAQGLTDNQVAEMLIISPRTVNWHLSSIYSKLQVSSRSAATRFAIEQKLI